ncbi:MAG: FUSC family protein, partial [Synechococcaceae bacterium WB9_2_170]|nr:FUSC family protein [Synechococcaceae bacterium WB9_2_170]
MLRAALVIGLAAAFTSAAVLGLGLSGSAVAFGAVIAALVVRPDFSRWPTAIYPVLLVIVAIGLGIGTCLGQALASVPQVFVFGLVAALMQVLTLFLPPKLSSLSGVLAVVGVLPLLSSNPSWSSARDELLAIALGLAIGTGLQVLFTPITPRSIKSSTPDPQLPEGHRANNVQKP